MISKNLRTEDLIGKTCHPTREILNGAGAVIGTDTICTIRNVVRGHGITIVKESCPHCHVGVLVRGLSREDLELVKVNDKPTPYVIDNRHLTTDELKALPLKSWVWVEIIEPICGPANVTSAYFRKCAVYDPEDTFACGYPGWQTDFEYKEYGKTWLAYKFEPERGTVNVL